MTNTSVFFDCIDEILGPKEERFFGKGFGKVIHNISDIDIRNELVGEYITVNGTQVKVDSNTKGCVQAKGTLAYPKDWSQKSESSELKPHLSSIDALIISAQLNEIYLINSYDFDDTERKQIWLRRCTISAGNSPQESLNSFDICTLHLGTKESQEYLCSNISVFESQIGALKVRSEIVHPSKNILCRNTHFNRSIDVLGDPNKRYYGNGYKNSEHSIKNVKINIKEETVESLININQANKGLPSDGIEAVYRPSISMVDSIIICGQISQAFLYILDNVSRAQSNTLWLRTVTIESTTPYQPCDTFLASIRMVKSRLLNVKGEYWRTANMTGSFRGITINYSIAHELPVTV